MYLRELSLYSSNVAALPYPHTSREFNAGTHTPVETFLDLLPRRKVWLGDLAKVNVVVGPRPAEASTYFEALNVAIIYWPWFKFPTYFALDRAAQQRRVVDVLYRALLRIAYRTESPTHWFESAFSELAATPFPLPEIPERELLRRWGLLSPRGIASRRRRKGNPA